MGLVKGARKLEPGDSLLFTVTPKEGFTVASVTANGVELEPVSVASASELEDESGELSYVLIEVEEDVEIEVEFSGIALLSLLADIPGPGVGGSDVDYREMSSAFRIDYENSYLDEDSDSFYVDVVIEETEEDELVFSISEVMLKVLNTYEYPYSMLPGDHENLHIRFINESGNQYSYQLDSLVVAPPDLRERVADDGDDIAHGIGFDGQEIPLRYSMARWPNEAIQKLVGKSSSGRVSLDDMLRIYDTLREKPEYADLEYPLTQWYLDYYKVDNLMDLSNYYVNELTGSKQGVWANGIYSVSYKDSSFEEKYEELLNEYPYMQYCRVEDRPQRQELTVQLTEIEPEIGALIYNKFFQNCLGITVGRKTDEDEANSSASVSAVAVGQYMTEDSAVWDEANTALSSLTLEKSGWAEMDTGILLSGPDTGNAYQNYEAEYYAAIVLDRVITEGSHTINKVDDDGQLIANPAVFVIYKEEDGKTLYRTGDGWSENKADAEEYTTSGGSVVVPSLDLGVTYYVEEVKAPEGYELVTVPRPVEMSEESMEINFSNKAQYTIVINYYEDGTTNKLTDSYVSDVFTKGEAFDVTTEIQKTISGYNWTRCDQEVYAGVIDGNLVFNVYYTRRSSGNHNGGGGGGSTTPRPSNPSQSGPGVITEINPDEVPLGALPEETVIIPDGEVPLAALPKTGQESRRNAWCMLMAGLALTACGLFYGRREEDR